MAVILTNGEYADVHFVYIFRNESGWSAITEYQRCYPHQSSILKHFLEYIQDYSCLVPCHKWKQP
jgi:hypothetical protein